MIRIHLLKYIFILVYVTTLSCRSIPTYTPGAVPEFSSFDEFYKSMKEGKNQYAPSQGIHSLRKEISNYYSKYIQIIRPQSSRRWERRHLCSLGSALWAARLARRTQFETRAGLQSSSTPTRAIGIW